MDNNQKLSQNGIQLIERIKILLTHVCEQGKESYKPNIQKLYKNLINIYDSNSKDQLVVDALQNYFIECVSSLQFKSSIYATTLCLVAQNSSTLSSIILDGIYKALQTNLNNFNIEKSKCLLLFIGQLMNNGLINSFTFITILYGIINEAENIESQGSDFYLYLLITILPYLYENLAEKSSMELKNLQENIDSIIKKRQTHYLKCQLPFNAENPQDFITVFWQTFQSEIKNQSQEDFTQKIGIMQFQALFKDEFKNLKQLQQATKFYFKDKVFIDLLFQQLNKIIEQNKYQTPFYFSIFSQNSLKQLLIKIALADLIRAFWKKKSLLIKNLHNFLMFEIPASEYVPLLVETIFTELLMLPEQPCKQIAYSSLVIGLIEDSKQLDDSGEFEKLFLQYINEAITNFFFPQIGEMDKELILRFQNFLAHILSYNIKLLDWGLMQTKCSTEIGQFLTQLFHKIQLMSSIDLNEELPEMNEYFGSLEWKINLTFSNISEEIEGESSTENILLFQDYSAVKEKLAKKISAQEMMNFLNSDSLENSNNSKIMKQIFLEAFFERIHKSIGFIKILFDRYKDVFFQYILAGDKEESQMLVLNSLRTFWKNHQKQIVIYASKFMDYQLLEPQTIMKWLLGKFIFEDKEDFQSISIIILELISSIFSKLKAQIRQIQFELKHQKTKLESSNEENKKDNNQGNSEQTQKIEDLKSKEEILKTQFKQLLLNLVNNVYSALETNPSKPIAAFIINSFAIVFRLYKEFSSELIGKLEEQFFALYEAFPELKNIVSSIISLS